MALAKTTQDHDEIRKWAEARGGKPAVVAATEGNDETGIIRLMFPNAPNHNDDALEEIGWDEWFEKFDESGLQMVYQEETADGQQSDFNRLTYPDPESAEGKALLKKSASKKSTTKKSAKSAVKKPTTATKAKANIAEKKPAKPAAKSAAKPAAKSAPKTTASKPATKKTAAKKAPAKKTASKKTASKKTASKSASKKTSSSTPARNYPRPDSNTPTQVF